MPYELQTPQPPRKIPDLRIIARWADANDNINVNSTVQWSNGKAGGYRLNVWVPPQQGKYTVSIWRGTSCSGSAYKTTDFGVNGNNFSIVGLTVN